MPYKFQNLLVLRISPLIVLVLCFLSACTGNSSRSGKDITNQSNYQKISAETAYQMMQKSSGYIILDVRTDEEFRESHIAGAILIPNTEIAKQAVSELPDKNSMIFVYCRSGVRSASAAKTLVRQGYTQVYDIGGIINWPYETVRN